MATTGRSISTTSRRAPPAITAYFRSAFPTAVDRFITLWEMAGEAMADPIIKEATEALQGRRSGTGSARCGSDFQANKELLTLHELIAHRLVQILLGLHRGRTYAV